MQNIWFTGDLHLGHFNVIRFCNRLFASTNEMDESLIDNYNRLVKPNDIVYILGDLFWKTLTQEQANSYAARLNGQKHYIFGNHEERMQHKDIHKYFVWRKDYAEIHPADQKRMVLFHYPLRSWHGSNYGTYCLHGHCHGNLPEIKQGLTNEESPLIMDVGVDCNNMYPFSLKDVVQKMKSKKGLHGDEEGTQL